VHPWTNFYYHVIQLYRSLLNRTTQFLSMRMNLSYQKQIWCLTIFHHKEFIRIDILLDIQASIKIWLFLRWFKQDMILKGIWLQINQTKLKFSLSLYTQRNEGSSPKQQTQANPHICLWDTKQSWIDIQTNFTNFGS